MADLTEFIEGCEGSFTDNEVEEILQRIRNNPLDEIDEDPVSGVCPLFTISEHYIKYNLTSERDLGVLLDIFKGFAARGVSLNRTTFEDTTLLHDAVRLGEYNIDVIKFLVDYDVDNINIKQEGEYTAADIAMELGRHDIVSILNNNVMDYELKDPGDC